MMNFILGLLTIMKTHPKQKNEMKEFCIIVNKYT
jgi:hypothetical protein